MNKLDRKALHYCGEICNRQVLQLCKRNGKEIWDFPAIAVACNAKNTPIYVDHSRGVREQHVYDPLKSELKRIGNIGESSRICSYILGRCAEQHAANKLLKKHKKKLTDIYFSKAYRPKTLQVFDYCDNCLYLFPNLK